MVSPDFLSPDFQVDALLKGMVAMRLSWAEGERERIRLRSMLVQQAARAAGKHVGRPQTVPVERIQKLAAKGWNKERITKRCKVSVRSVYRAITKAG